MRRFRLLIVVLLVCGVAFWLMRREAVPAIAQGSVLVLPIEGAYVEAHDPSALARLLTDAGVSFATLLSELKKAERDDRLAAVVLRLRDLDIGWAQAQELRTAIRGLRDAGRRTVAYLEISGYGANIEYYVASAADEVRIAPGGFGGVVGLAGEYLFLGQMWRKFGIEFDVARAGRYKSAVETLTGDAMSDAYREVANSLLDSINRQFVAGIAEGRKLPPDSVQQLIDRAPMTPEQLVESGLADGVAFLDELVASLGGEAVEAEDYAAIDPASLGFKATAQFALVYGSGNVVVGDGSLSSRGNPVMASDEVSRALRDAAEDPEIDAIIFRIDSPGGSVLAADIIWRALEVAKRSEKPLIASLSNVAASGGYYVVAGADSIVAPPGSVTGSIGVFALRPVVRGLLDKLDVQVEALTRGAHADLLISSQPLSPETAALLDREVEEIYALFVERVAAGRKLGASEVDAVAQGRVWTGEQALERGLIDGLGGLREAVARGKQALGLDPGADVALVPYPQRESLADQLGDVLRRASLAVRPVGSLPGLAGSIQVALEAALLDAAALEAAPLEAPALVPPFAFDIR